MTAGTAMMFVVTGAILVAAVAGVIWLESRMPAARDQSLPRPVAPEGIHRLADDRLTGEPCMRQVSRVDSTIRPAAPMSVSQSPD
jgi:hypothetical protein